MQVDAYSAYTSSLFYARQQQTDPVRSSEAQSSAAVPQDNKSTQRESEASKVATAIPSPFEAETLAYINSLLREEGKDTYTLDEWRDYQSDLAMENMQKVASDPTYAAEQARFMANSYDALLIPQEHFDAAIREGRLPPGSYPLDDPNNPAIQVREQRLDFYNQKVAEGLPPAELYMEMLKFNANLPDSYGNDALDPTNSYPDGYWKSQVLRDISMLEAAMNPVDTTA